MEGDAGARAEAAGILRSARAVSGATLISRILGLAREQTVAALFSRTQTDAFTIAFRIPNLLRDLFAEGAMSAAFVPTFTEQMKRRPAAEAWRFAATVLTLLAIGLSALAVLGMLLAPRLAALFASDYAAVDGKLELTVGLTRAMFPFLPLVAMAAAAMGCLNARGRFFIPALAPAMFNVASIGCAWMLAPVLERHPAWGLDPVFALAVGTLAGGLGQLLIQIPLLRREGMPLVPRLDVLDPAVRRVLALMAPGTLGLAAVQVNLLVTSVLATGEGEGPVSWLQFAFRFMYLPIGLFGVAIAAAALPAMASHHAAGDLAAMRRTLAQGLRSLLMITVPATAGLLVLAEPIIAAVYQHGRFQARDTLMTAEALRWYAAGLAAYASAKLLVPAFYTLGRTAVPVAASVLSVAVNALLSLLLIRTMGFRGLALATSLTAFLNGALLYALLRVHLGPLDTRRLAAAFLRIAVATAGMAAAAAGADTWLAARLPVGGDDPALWAQVARLAGGMVAALAALGLGAWALRLDEFWMAVGLRRR